MECPLHQLVRSGQESKTHKLGLSSRKRKHINNHSRHNDYSQLSYFSELISITVTVTVTIIIFPGINYKTVMWQLQRLRLRLRWPSRVASGDIAAL